VRQALSGIAALPLARMSGSSRSAYTAHAVSTHIRSPGLLLGKPLSLLLKARLEETRPYYMTAGWCLLGCHSIARFVTLTSDEADQASWTSVISREAWSCRLQDGAFGHDAIAAEAPQRNQQLAGERHDHGLPHPTFLARHAGDEPLAEL
jgi:hypothetical protein